MCHSTNSVLKKLVIFKKYKRQKDQLPIAKKYGFIWWDSTTVDFKCKLPCMANFTPFCNCFVYGLLTTQQKNYKMAHLCKFKFEVISWKLLNEVFTKDMYTMWQFHTIKALYYVAPYLSIVLWACFFWAKRYKQ